MAKKEREPEYIPSALNTPMLNYRVYYMDRGERFANRLIGFVAGGLIGLVFYGNQFLDSEGYATGLTNIVNALIFVISGIIGMRVFYSIREKQLCDKRRLELTSQFRSFLAALTVSLSSGMNMTESIAGAYQDLRMQYSDKAYIVHETEELLNGIRNGVDMESMMAFLGERSSNPDIRNFGLVFTMCYRTGGNLKDVVQRTSDIISEKIAINEQIETTLTSNKTQFTAMVAIPVVLMLMLRSMSSSFAAGFSTVPGVIAVTIALIMFVLSYRLGMKIMDVKG